MYLLDKLLNSASSNAVKPVSRLFKRNKKGSAIWTVHELFVYMQRKEGDKLWFDPVRVYCDNGADLVVFSYLMNTIVFDTTKQLIYSVKGDKNDGKLRLDELPKPEERVVPEQKNVIALEKVCETQT